MEINKERIEKIVNNFISKTKFSFEIEIIDIDYLLDICRIKYSICDNIAGCTSDLTFQCDLPISNEFIEAKIVSDVVYNLIQIMQQQVLDIFD